MFAANHYFLVLLALIESTSQSIPTAKPSPVVAHADWTWQAFV